MQKRFDHIEKSVETLKHDSKLLKDQNVKLSKQVTDLQTTVAHLESKEQILKMNGWKHNPVVII